MLAKFQVIMDSQNLYVNQMSVEDPFCKSDLIYI